MVSDYFPRWSLETLESELRRLTAELPELERCGDVIRAADYAAEIQRMQRSLEEKRRIAGIIAAMMGT